MSVATEESDDAMLSETQSASLLYDEGNSGENTSRGFVLKKGPWTSAEDAILLEYVKRHGEGNWNAVQRHSGLFRCGKSCRLRWANHLRPNLKKGTFTPDEEHLIVQLHAKMGNKWARMAARLPGRTDNEIKNYWNTRIKRRQRAGLPLYPPEVCLQVLQENQSLNSSGIDSEDKRYNGLLQTNSYDFSGYEFNGLNADYGLLPYPRQPSEMSSSNSHMKGPGSSQYCSFIPPVMPRRMQFQDSVHLSSIFDGDIGNRCSQFDLIQDDPCNKDDHSFGLSFPYDPDHTTNYHFPFKEIQGSHSLFNGNFSASKPISRAVKLELPSLQYLETDFGICGTSVPPPPFHQSVDTLMQSENSSPHNSGLLDAVLHEANTLQNAKGHSSDKSSDSSTVTPCDLAYSTTLNFCDRELEDYSESISTFGPSASTTSIFSECTPNSGGGSSLSEYTRADIFPGHKVKSEPADQVWTPEGEMEVSTRFSSPSALFELDWFRKTKGQPHMNDTISTLLGSDCASAYMHS